MLRTQAQLRLATDNHESVDRKPHAVALFFSPRQHSFCFSSGLVGCYQYWSDLERELQNPSPTCRCCDPGEPATFADVSTNAVLYELEVGLEFKLTKDFI